MRLATGFKVAVATTGLVIAGMGTLAVEAALKDRDHPPESVTCEISAKKDVDLAVTSGGAFFFAGTTLLAAGLRRRKTPEKKGWRH